MIECDNYVFINDDSCQSSVKSDSFATLLTSEEEYSNSCAASEDTNDDYGVFAALRNAALENETVAEKDEETRPLPSDSTVQCKPDEYLYCFICQSWVINDCWKHPVNLLEKPENYFAVKNDVVCAEQKIPSGVLFGPCKGTMVNNESDKPDKCLWEIDTFTGNIKQRRFLCADETTEAWSSALSTNPARKRANVIPIQFCGEIYFRTMKTINAGAAVIIAHNGGFGNHHGRIVDSGFFDKQYLDKITHARAIDRLYCRIDGKWHCRGCPFETDVYSRMIYHSKTVHRRSDDESSISRRTCEVCSKVLASPTSLRKHMATHEQNRRFRCNQCSLAFRLKQHLHRHEAVIHGERRERKVGRKARTASEKPLQCRHCGSEFSNAKDRRDHMEMVHSLNARENGVSCLHCGRLFANEMALVIHLRRLQPEKLPSRRKEKVKQTHVCNLCSKHLSSSTELRYHLMRHTGKFPYYCQGCDFGYPTSSELNKHQKRCVGFKNKTLSAVPQEGTPQLEQSMDTATSV